MANGESTQSPPNDHKGRKNRRKMDVPGYIQALIAVIALTGGGLGWYQTVIAESTAREQMEFHDSMPSAHFESTKKVEERLNNHDIDLVQIKADIKATKESTIRIEKLLEANQKTFEAAQQAILEEIRRSRP